MTGVRTRHLIIPRLDPLSSHFISADILSTSVFGSCVAPQDEVLLAAVLRHFADSLLSDQTSPAERVLTR